MKYSQSQRYMARALTLAVKNVAQGCGGPFGAIIVRQEKIIAQGTNRVTLTNDCTAHAEIVAIRKACKKLHTFVLDDCELYTSCEPCPMCLGAIYWARIRKVYYLNTKEEAAAIGFDDAYIYEDLQKPISERNLSLERVMVHDALRAFETWSASSAKIPY